MFRKKFVDRLRDKYQRGGERTLGQVLSASSRLGNPLLDPSVSIGARDVNTGFGTRTALGGKLSVPILDNYQGTKGYSSLRGELDAVARSASRKGISKIEDQLGSGHVNNPMPDYAMSHPKVANVSLGVRGIYNRGLGRRNNTLLKSNIGVGFGTGDYEGEYMRYNPDKLGDVEFMGGTYPDLPGAPLKPYLDANLSLARKFGRSTPGTVGMNVGYGTKTAPNPGLRVGAQGTRGPFQAGVEYDITNKAPRFNVGLKFQSGGMYNQPEGMYQTGGAKDTNKLLSLAAKGIKAIPRVASFAGSKVLGPLGMLLGSKKAYGATIYDEHGVNKYTGKKDRWTFDNPPPASWTDSKSQTPMEISSLDIRKTGGIDDNTIGDGRKTLAELREEARRRKYYQTGGVALPGGEMQQIPGTDAVEFSGQTHDQGGIMMDPQTEVEDGETMDQVTMAKHGGKRKDYFFSSYLKKGGTSFADMHKQILQEGGNQEDIDWLAKMQEKAAGRNPKKIAKNGGIRKYQFAGSHESDSFDVDNLIEESGDGDIIRLPMISAEDQWDEYYKNYLKENPVPAPEKIDVYDVLDNMGNFKEDKGKQGKQDGEGWFARLKSAAGDTPTSAYIAGLAQMLPAAQAYWGKQPDAEQVAFKSGVTSPIIAREGKSARLERVDYNQDIANIGADTRAMNKFIETSGGGPANIINKMLAFKKGQDAKAKVRAAETRANLDIANREAQMEQQMTLSNLQRAQQAQTANAQLQRAEAAREQQLDIINAQARQKLKDDKAIMKGKAVGAFAQGIAGILGDVLDYKSAERVARNIGTDGIYDRQQLYDRFISEGLSEDEAKKKAAAVVNLLKSKSKE